MADRPPDFEGAFYFIGEVEYKLVWYPIYAIAEVYDTIEGQIATFDCLPAAEFRITQTDGLWWEKKVEIDG